MIDITLYPIFMNHMSDLKSVSVDKHDSDDAEYMTQSLKEVVDFDAVKNEYVKTLGLSEIPSSNDALFHGEEDTLVFAEFKNGRINKRKKYSLQKKIYDSVMIFGDITSVGISRMRKDIDYILVYNEKANVDAEPSENLQRSVQDSPALDSIAKTIGNLAKEEHVKFGLEMFQNYCFRRVHTYTEQEFEKYLQKSEYK